MENMDNNLEKKMLSGRTSEDNYNFVKELQETHGFDKAMEMLIQNYKSRPVQAEDFSVSKDINDLKDSMANFVKIIDGIEAKSKEYVKSSIQSANIQVESKDAMLLETTEKWDAILEEYNIEFNALSNRNLELETIVSSLQSNLEDANSEISKKEKEISKMNTDLEQLNVEKTRLNKDVINKDTTIQELKEDLKDFREVKKISEKIEKELSSANHLNKELQDKVDVLSVKNEETIKLNCELEKIKEEQSVIINNNIIEVNKLSGLLESKESIVKDKEDYIKQLKDVIQDLKTDKKALSEQIKELKKEIESSKTKK